MTRRSGRRRRDRELLQAIETQNKLHDALKSLFELLETYSPVWYEKRYHDKAKSALKVGANSMRQFNGTEGHPKGIGNEDS